MGRGDEFNKSRQCLVVKGKKGCPAYHETPEQIRNIVRIDMELEQTGDPNLLFKRFGTCRVTGAQVIKGNDCSIGNKLFIQWMDQVKRDLNDGPVA